LNLETKKQANVKENNLLRHPPADFNFMGITGAKYLAKNLVRKLQVQVGHLVVDSIGFKPLVTDSAEGNICEQGCRSRQAA
jgi:hypothetical protein